MLETTCIKQSTGLRDHSSNKTPLLNPFRNDKILDWSILKEFADDKFKLHENGRMFLKQAGNTVGEGEVARCEQFLLFQQCFQKNSTADT